jgi:hypothetical protein
MTNYKDYIVEMADLSGMETECIPHNVLVDELNRIVGWTEWDEEREGKKKPTFTPGEDLPRIHSKVTKKMSFENPEETIDDFIDFITFDPSKDKILGSNHKIEQSGLTQEVYVKVGIPAFIGILYDEEKNQFFTIKTCPGAHGCEHICYARKGNYIRYGTNFQKSTKTMNLLINHPDVFEKQLTKELTELCVENEAFPDSYSWVTLRYNESGDFFWDRYLEIANRVIGKLKKRFNIRATAYTKMASVINQRTKHIDTTFSKDFSRPGEVEKIENPQVRLATILPKQKFEKLFFVPGEYETDSAGNVKKDRRGNPIQAYRKRPTISGMKKLKELISQERGIPMKNILGYNEMMRMPEGRVPKYYVIVMSGDGDDAVSRRDVKEVILAEH